MRAPTVRGGLGGALSLLRSCPGAEDSSTSVPATCTAMTARAARTWRRTRGDQGCAWARRVAGPCPCPACRACLCARAHQSLSQQS